MPVFLLELPIIIIAPKLRFPTRYSRARTCSPAQNISSPRNWQASKIYPRGSYFMLAAGPSLHSRPALLVIVGRRVGGSTASAAKFRFAPPPRYSPHEMYISTLGPKKVGNHCSKASLHNFHKKLGRTQTQILYKLQTKILHSSSTYQTPKYYRGSVV